VLAVAAFLTSVPPAQTSSRLELTAQDVVRIGKARSHNEPVRSTRSPPLPTGSLHRSGVKAEAFPRSSLAASWPPAKLGATTRGQALERPSDQAGAHRLPIPLSSPVPPRSTERSVGIIAGTTTRLRDRRGPHRHCEVRRTQLRRAFGTAFCWKSFGAAVGRTIAAAPRLVASPPIPRGRTALSKDIYVRLLR
jgi:hypothetical protein